LTTDGITPEPIATNWLTKPNWQDIVRGGKHPTVNPVIVRRHIQCILLAMRRSEILPTVESASAQAEYETYPPQHNLVAGGAMLDLLAPGRPIPCRADRQRIIEHASLTVAKAQATAAHFDRFFMFPPDELASAEVFSSSSLVMVST
jgi:hypothetical protein